MARNRLKEVFDRELQKYEPYQIDATQAEALNLEGVNAAAGWWIVSDVAGNAADFTANSIVFVSNNRNDAKNEAGEFWSETYNTAYSRSAIRNVGMKAVDFGKPFGLQTDKGFVVFKWVYSQDFHDDWGHWDSERPDLNDAQMYIDRTLHPPVLLGLKVSVKVKFDSAKAAESALEDWDNNLYEKESHEEYTDKDGKVYLVGGVDSTDNDRIIELFARPVLFEFPRKYGAERNSHKFYIPDGNASNNEVKYIIQNFMMISDINNGETSVMDFGAELYESEDEYYDGEQSLDEFYSSQYIDPDDAVQKEVVEDALAELSAKPINMDYVQVSKRPEFDEDEYF